MGKIKANDIVGGAVAGLLAIPEAMAYAVIIFGPLAVFRPDILPIGIISCILAVVFSNTIPLMMRGPRILVGTPFSLASVMMGVLSIQIVASVTPAGGEPDIDLALVLLFEVVAISGLIQVLLGLLRLGDLAKFVPMPVIAGLRNGAAVVILISQVRPLLGLDDDAAISTSSILWPTALIGAFSFLVMMLGSRLTSKVPSAVLAIITGTAAYYLLATFGWSSELTDIVGTIPSAIPLPRYADDFVVLFTSAEVLNHLLPLLPTAVALAVLNTLQTLIAIVTADNLTETRSHSNRELVGFGLGNFVSGLFGGMSASGAVGGTLANFGSGGRKLPSRLAAGALALAVVLFLSPVISYLPKIVLAGCLVALAFSMFDRPGFTLLGDAVQGKVSMREALKDLSIIVTVMVILLVFGPLYAVGAGVVVALAHFILSMANDNIRRELSGESVRSYVHRNDEENEALVELGKLVRIIELEGPLFFGTSDRLTTKVEELSKEDIEFILLDFAQTSEIDTTAVALTCQARNACLKNGCRLVLSSLETRPAIARFLSTTKLYTEFDDNDIHASKDDGLAYIEDELLDRRFGAGRYLSEIPLEDIAVLKAIGIDHLAQLKPFLSRKSFVDDEIVIKQGDAARAVFFVVSGQANIEVRVDGDHLRNLGVLCPGAIFGEMAVLDGKPRSATIVAVGSLECIEISTDNLEHVGKSHPEARHALMAAIGLELAKRIRISNTALAALKS
ncbi:MAG: SulP family inorganic anion transporter [Rhizobiaceae bacterium]